MLATILSFPLYFVSFPVYFPDLIMAGRQLQLAKRDNFFSDPFFSDFMNLDDEVRAGGGSIL
jgi:hypothetical protein